MFAAAKQQNMDFVGSVDAADLLCDPSVDATVLLSDPVIYMKPDWNAAIRIISRSFPLPEN